ncbi:MAG TPA: oligosaccharide flippase family protein [Gemmatimonadales bacterium]|nr:oligosaccharide flippase family protein [Gemmatimonadales bacterium]
MIPSAERPSVRGGEIEWLYYARSKSSTEPPGPKPGSGAPIRTASPQDHRALWHNSAAQLLGTIAARLSRAGGILISARLLPVDDFGRITAALAGYEMLRVLGEAGLDTRLVRYVAGEPARAAVEVRRTIVLKLAIYAALFLIALVITRVALGPADLSVFGSLAIGIFGMAVTFSVQAAATGRLDAKGMLPQQAIAGLVFFALVTMAAAGPGTAWATALAIGVADLAGGAIFLTYLRRVPEAFAGIGEFGAAILPALRSWRGALRESLPIGGTTIVGTAYLRIGIGVLSLAWGTAAVAQYGISYRVVEVFLMASAAIGGSAYAVTARVEASGGAGAGLDLLATILRRTALPIFAGGVLVAIGAQLLPLIFGTDYIASVGTTRVLAFALPPMFLNGLLTAHLYGRGRYTTVLRIALINLGLNVLLLAALVPSGGPPGAALAVVATECGNTYLQSRAAGLGRGTWATRVVALSLILGALTFAMSYGR